MNKEALALELFGHPVSEEDLAYRLFGRPIRPGRTFEETFDDFELAHSQMEFGQPSPEVVEARERIDMEDILWARQMNALGPYCPWPKQGDWNDSLEEGEESLGFYSVNYEERRQQREEERRLAEITYPSHVEMARNLAKTAAQAFSNRPVSHEVYQKRLETCRMCPAFDPDQERCKKCGCFMVAKARLGGDPDELCPLKKWSNL